MNILQVKFPLNSLTSQLDLMNLTQGIKYDSRSPVRGKTNQLKKRSNIADYTLRKSSRLEKLQLIIESNLNLKPVSSSSVKKQRKIIQKPKEVHTTIEKFKYPDEPVDEYEKQYPQGKISKLQIHFQRSLSQRTIDLTKTMKLKQLEQRLKVPAMLSPLSYRNQFNNRGSISSPRKSYKQFQFSKLPYYCTTPRKSTEKYQQSSSPLSQNYFIGDEQNINMNYDNSFQNNSLRKILAAKRNNLKDFIAQDRTTKKEQDLNYRGTDTAPRKKDRKEDYTYFDLLRLPFQRNESCQQINQETDHEFILIQQDLKLTNTPQQKNDKKSQEPYLSKTAVIRPITKQDFTAFKDITEQRKPRILLNANPRISQGGNISTEGAKGKKKLQHCFPDHEGFEHRSELDTEDYFHYYVKSQKD